jgi:exoribonuclease R
MFRGLHPSSTIVPFVPSNSPAYDMIMMDESRCDTVDGVNLWELFIDLSTQSKAKSSVSSSLPVEDQIADGELYPRHLDPTSLETGIKSGVLYRGTIRVQRHRTKSAVVELLGASAALRLRFPRGFLIADEQAMNRAFHGDEVAIEMISSSDNSISSQSASIMDVADSVGVDLPSFNSQSDAHDRPLARVCGILSRQWRPYVCMVAAEDLSGERSHVMCVPMDIRVPRIRINTRQAASLAGQRIVVSVDEWNSTQRNPHGHFVSRLGPVWQADTETRAILIEHQLSAPAYSMATEEAFVPSGIKSSTLAVPFNIPASGMLGRRDLRQSHCVVSIDPPGCTDIDDALSLCQLPNGNYELGVHMFVFCLPKTSSRI